jgi:very-short-patch-repair endonuclease
MKEMFGVEDDEIDDVYFQYPIQRYLCDFVDVKNKIVFMINGDFWHANPILYKKEDLSEIQRYNLIRDKNKRNYLELKGWACIIVWESEINWNRDLVKEKIRDARKLVNPTVLHTDGVEFDSQASHQDWDSEVRRLWFSKKYRKIKVFKKKSQSKSKKVKSICENCKKEFTYYRQKGRMRKYCSRDCFLSSRSTNKISKEDLIERLKIDSWSKIGRDCGVSDNAVRKWAKGYGLI